MSKDSSPNASVRANERNVARDTVASAADTAASTMRDVGSHYVAEPARDLLGLLSDYAREKPDVAALWALGLGIMIGWKLRG